jgi:penicillin-binding protein 1A
MSRLRQHFEHYLVGRIGWMRAAVVWANDGTISTARWIVGVAAAAAKQSSVLIAGVAGLVAGAMSMAARECVSVSSQSHTEQADLARERKEQGETAESELDELAEIYVKRGVGQTLARPTRPIPNPITLSAATGRLVDILSGLFNAIVIGGGAILGPVVAFETTLSERYPIEHTLRSPAKLPLVLISADGLPFAKRGECMAEPVTLDELPRHFIDAVLATEDRRFYSHVGIDPRGILRAASRNYKAGVIREGGSTITQQLVKISFLTSATTLERKLEEALLAMWLEKRLTKNQILERYLSSVYFGKGCFGVRAAARHFFDKPVGELNVSESVLMVALLRSPTRFSTNLDEARQGAKLVVRAMVRDGRLDEKRLAHIRPAGLVAARSVEFGGYYADWLADSLQMELKDRHSPQPVQVYTTFEPALQRIAEETIQKVLNKQGGRLHASQAALVAMRTDGRVVAIVGGKDWQASPFNRAVQARRQPGSAFKTFVYLAALRAGARPDMVLVDEPISVEGWEPKNFGGGQRGNVTLTQAFSWSINTVAVKLSEAVGRDAVIGTARDLGIASPIAPNPSLALGASEVSLLEMTAAYAAIAVGAYPVKPWGVAGLDAKPARGGEPPREAGLWKLAKADRMRELLSSVIRNGTGRAAWLPIPAFGKTGTSQEHRDAWFIGFAGNLVIGVWVGNDDNTPMIGVTGGGLPAEIWQLVMQKALDSDPDFRRKLPQIAVFGTRSREPVERSSGLASLEALAVVADPESTSRSTHAMERSHSRRHRLADQELERRESISSDHDLSDMIWPGRY